MTDSNKPNPDKDESLKTTPDAIDKTLEWSPSSSPTGDAGSDPSAFTLDETVFGGIDESTDPFGIEQARKRSKDADVDQTVSNIDATIKLDSVQLRPSIRLGTGSTPSRGSHSVMQSADVSQTINPRELNKEDAAAWGSAALGGSKGNSDEDTKLQPAIDRSISETRLQIRQRDLAAPTRDPELPSDYRLVKLLGRGGMGNVYVARQTSLDRMIAVKVIKPLPKTKRVSLSESGRLSQVEYERRQQFLSEAVITGDLDHPNIVPIHDVAVAPDNTLFYAMKRVVGEPWSKSIDETDRDQNLEIMMKVCDAVAFAHTRGVVHRDIKPENIMLGGFGEVLVMDWGLALPKEPFEKRDSISFTAGLGGTPAFMAPEMALGPIESITAASDIYLLGATLFYIITGFAPHKAKNVTECIRAVSVNKIQPAPENCQGELLDIALKAMATDPANRYEDVKSFQDAIRSYRSHSESIALSTVAQSHYDIAKQTQHYESFSRATFGFDQAIALWSENDCAIEGLKAVSIDHAKAALSGGDYELGLSLLDRDNPDHQSVIGDLNEAVKQREQRHTRLKLFRRLAVAALVVILVGGSVALYWINAERQFANKQRSIALLLKGIAQKQEDIANKKTIEADESKNIALDRLAEVERQKQLVEEQTKKTDKEAKAAIAARKEAVANAVQANQNAAEALKNLGIARTERERADESAEEADNARKIAEDEAYLSQIGLVKASIDRNEFNNARSILKAIRTTNPEKAETLEWRALWDQANRFVSTVSLDAAVLDISCGPQKKFVITIDAGSKVHRIDLIGNRVNKDPAWTSIVNDVGCTAVNEQGTITAVGTRSGEIVLLETETGREQARWQAHEDSVTDLLYRPNGELVSSSNDRTVALWKPNSQTLIDRAWHIAAVHGLSASDAASGILLAAVSDQQRGRVVGWKLPTTQQVTFKPLGIFDVHTRPVNAVAISLDGRRAASGDADGKVILWNPVDLASVDYESEIETAIERLKDASGVVKSAAWRTSKSTQSSTPPQNTFAFQAHPDAIATLRFDPSGDLLLSGSDDYTAALWSVKDRSQVAQFRGHGGWVRSLSLLGPTSTSVDQEDAILVSGSVDGTLRTWDIDETVIRQKPVPMISVALNMDADNDLDANQQRRESTSNRGVLVHDDEILSASLNASGNRLITASRDRTARVLSLNRTDGSLDEIARIELNSSDSPAGVGSAPQGTSVVSTELAEGTDFLAMSAAVDDSRKRLFVGNADGAIRIWDIHKGTEIGILLGTGLNTTFALAKSGDRLLSGSSDKDAKAILWDVRPQSAENGSAENGGTPTVLIRLTGHQEPVTAMAISDNAKRLVTGDRDGRCLVWDGQTGKAIGPPIDLYRGFRINQLAFSPQADRLWIASDSGQLAEIDLATGTKLRTHDHDGLVVDFALDQATGTAVTLSTIATEQTNVSTVLLWKPLSQQPLVIDRSKTQNKPSTTNRGDRSRIHSIRLADDGKNLVVCRQTINGQSGSVVIKPLQGGNERAFEMPRRIGAPESGLMLSENHLLTLNGEAVFRWNLKQFAHDRSYRPHASVFSANFAPDSKLVATASRSVRFWNATTGRSIDKLENPHQGGVNSLDFASLNFVPAQSIAENQGADAYRFVTTGVDGVAKVWSWQAGEIGFRQQSEITLPNDSVALAKFTPDGQRILKAGRRGTLEIESLDDPDQIRRFRSPSQARITAAAFSSDNRYLIAAHADHDAYLYHLDANSVRPIRIIRGHADRIESIKFLNDQAGPLRIVTVSRDKSMRFWDPQLDPDTAENADADQLIAAREVLSLRGHTQGVTSVDATPSGDLLITAGRDGRVILWPAG